MLVEYQNMGVVSSDVNDLVCLFDSNQMKISFIQLRERCCRECALKNQNDIVYGANPQWKKKVVRDTMADGVMMTLVTREH